MNSSFTPNALLSIGGIETHQMIGFLILLAVIFYCTASIKKAINPELKTNDIVFIVLIAVLILILLAIETMRLIGMI